MSRHHHGSHRHLLASAPRPAGTARVDAIIVPTVRPPAYLRDAAAVAERLDCPLVTLSSGRYTSAARTMRGLGELGVELVAIDLSRHRPLPAPLHGPEFPRSTPLDCRADTAAKRNVGTLLATMTGWENVVFLDDDVVVPDPADLSRAAALLGSFDRVALKLGGFPDNSVVCHAYRDNGGADQATFVGAGAMAVAAARAPAYYPAVYNEDWFDLLGDDGLLRPTASVGAALQREYDPYGTPERARREEFGDVLGEGLMWLLDEGVSWQAADLDHWREVLRRRRRLVEDLLLRERRAPARAALLAAREQLKLIKARACHRFVEDWAVARKNWQAHLDSLPTGLTTARACAELRDRHPELAVHHQERRPAVYTLGDPPGTAAPYAVRIPRPEGGLVRFEPLTEAGIPALVTSFGQRPYFVRALARQESGHGVLLIAWDRERAVGTVYIWLDKAEEKRLRRRLPGTPLLMHLDLLPEYRDTGFGTMLVYVAEQKLIERGHSTVALGVDPDNQQAYRLYLRLGYRKWKHSPLPTTEEILHEDGTSERKPDRCHILYKTLSPFPSSLR
ncbi:GNAT family N-acetyltransferase [Nonomuraea endophytica]|uniref:GNAT family N-acetyltransferase n=1 Tax=Nonomuraea endophytica TaxID=714136 RepID=UPI0037C98E2B